MKTKLPKILVIPLCIILMTAVVLISYSAWATQQYNIFNGPVDADGGFSTGSWSVETNDVRFVASLAPEAMSVAKQLIPIDQPDFDPEEVPAGAENFAPFLVFKLSVTSAPEDFTVSITTSTSLTAGSELRIVETTHAGLNADLASLNRNSGTVLLSGSTPTPFSFGAENNGEYYYYSVPLDIYFIVFLVSNSSTDMSATVSLRATVHRVEV